MLYHRIFTAYAHPLRLRTKLAIRQQLRWAGSATIKSTESEYPTLTDLEDPGMNGGYINPPRIKRQFRDPHADWWDKQERRNFGEPIHEDNDILGMFSPHEYTHVKPKTAFFQIGIFISAVFALAASVNLLYPDKPSVAKKYEGGLQKELGGPDTVGARSLEE
ncbi:putative nadh:ubiquinone oxidoreductase subunit protein [Erysiphe neolycopersici]|uniref:Putative nadh:ubiquinone oxidoreductase subunit protein n=1 Tax=Erysiphe neolycopersici TaxID=212602 RepID=A0A420HS82_9PEZI|nr:putative nadh:ubiquinone oxidoreductase subunit protein [Erysiphe neolycopersici]